MRERHLAERFFENGYLLWLTIVVVLVAGLSAAFSLPRLEDPRIVNRFPIVITPVPGASAARVEALVTDVLEEALQEIPEIARLESTSQAGVSVISIELAPDVTNANNKEIISEIRDQLGNVRRLLPPESGEPVLDDKRDPVAYTLISAVSWDGPGDAPVGMLGRLAELLADRLRGVSGTSLVRTFGEPDEEVTVTVDPGELAALGLSSRELAARIAGADAKRPAGALRSPGSDVLIEVEGELDSVDRVRRIPILPGDDASLVTVGDIADVKRGWRTPEEEIARVDGRRSVLVAARVDPDVRVDAWAERAGVVVETFIAERGDGPVRVETVFAQERYTTEKLRTLVENLGAGVLVVVITVLLLLGFRASLIVGSALPLVVSIVLFGWQMSGGVVHQMSIFGMIIALGLLIDNAIVVTDEVASLKAKGLVAADAVRAAVGHLSLPLLASTLTTILAFAPIMLLPGNVGDFVGSIGTSVMIAVAASLVLALTVIAALAGRFTRAAGDGAKRRWWRDGIGSAFGLRFYRGALRFLLGRPVLAVALSLILPVAGFLSLRSLGSQFFPPVDRNMFEVHLWLPSGAGIEATEAAADRVEATLRELDGIEQVSWLVGGSHPSVYYNLIMNKDRSPHYAHAVVRTASADVTNALIDRAQLSLDARHPDAQLVVRRLQQGPPIPADIEYRVFGPSEAIRTSVTDRVRRALQEHPDVLHTRSSTGRGEAKLFFEAAEDDARLAGLTLTEIAAQLDGNHEGVTGGTIVEDTEQLGVRVRYATGRRRDLALIESTPLVAAGADQWVPAASLGSFALRPETATIDRFRGDRTDVISAFTRNGALPIDVSNAVLAKLEREGFQLPPGARLETGGAAEEDAAAKAALTKHAPTLAILMVAILILAFRSIRYALLLGVVAVLCLGLAFLSTWVISFPISFNTWLGTLGLIGVGLNDSIVVLAAIRRDPLAAAGDPAAVTEAVIESTRHVVATTLTTIGGFLPLLLFVGGDFWPSLAIVLAGGITGASLLALLFVPGMVRLLVGKRPELEGAMA